MIKPAREPAMRSFWVWDKVKREKGERRVGWEGEISRASVMGMVDEEWRLLFIVV